MLLNRWEFLIAYPRDLPSTISLLLGQYCCLIAENIVATVTDSAQLQKKMKN